ncbi:hypothetical protein HNO88_003148 [Novosphingobium chloroacetimidivorans]|uniref:Glycosyltransferase RgtA/B/C/D-like domain-containing protein n=1 Tax=Novosphingobium chloroacetimidivorans TaxID=1428314 RepID=A0A7W7KCB2_9SPHN|nr:hypothetical protein [Novosphingobium chloroacetimidivorans]MBB4859816.1 hypothetical protein [Novosphingobium chloroacetimidivorans]
MVPPPPPGDDVTQAAAQAGRRSGAGWVCALVPAVCLGVLLLRPVWDVDIFWQLKLGELILQRGGPIRHEPFAVTHLGQALPTVAWLGQAVFAWVREQGGWTGLRVFDALCWCGGFWVLAAACRRQGAAAGAVALALALSFIAALPAASIRPQTFGALCFGALLALLKLQLRTWKTVAAGTALLVLWQNLHPSASIGAMALAAHAAGGWAAWLRHRAEDSRSAPPWASALLVPVALVSMFATPDGLNILAVSARNAQASIAVGASEWLPLWIPANLTNALPVGGLTLIALGIAWRRRHRVAWSDLAVMLVMLAATVTAYRFVLFWAITTIPVIAVSVGRQRFGQSYRVATWLGVALVSVVTSLMWPTRFSDNLPLAAVATLRGTEVRGTIFTEPEFGGVLIDAGYPRWRVTLDGRYYRYTDGEWSRYGDVLAGTYTLRRIERRYRPAAFLLRPSHTTALCDALDRPDSGWRRIWRDEGAAVWVPRR